MGQPDEVCVQRALDGETRAFQTLVSRYSGAVFALVLSHLGKNADTEDIAQEVFLQAYRSLPNLRSPARFGAWLYAIGKRVCLHSLRQRKCNEVYFNELPDPAEFSDPQLERGVAEPVDRRIDVLDAVESLPLIYREVVILRYMEDYPHAKIAGILGISESAVNVRLIKARRMVRDRLEKIFQG